MELRWDDMDVWVSRDTEEDKRVGGVGEGRKDLKRRGWDWSALR